MTRRIPHQPTTIMVYEQEKIKPYKQDGKKGEQVEQMFDHIAHSYDQLNHRLSWNIDKMWRNAAIKKLAEKQPQTILDVATGTGEKMMEIGQQKVAVRGLQDIISFKKEDCTALTLPSNSFDAVMAAFGIRNFADLDKGLAEMCRVLKPGGMLTILELTTPVRTPMKQLFKVYSHTVLPVYGRLVSRDTSAYSYLTATIEAFPQGERMVDILLNAGFAKATFRRLTFGICTMYVATK